MNISNFNIRVYGILQDAKGQVLVSHERIKNEAYCKFPGGGLEYGEGPKDGLMREFKEELGIKISVDELLYVTDFFIQSAFRDEDQIVSIYYSVSSSELASIETVNQWPDAHAVIAQKQLFHWVDAKDLEGGKLSFPGDRSFLAQLSV